jgi:hypothetical protein
MASRKRYGLPGVILTYAEMRCEAARQRTSLLVNPSSTSVFLREICLPGADFVVRPESFRPRVSTRGRAGSVAGGASPLKDSPSPSSFVLKDGWAVPRRLRGAPISERLGVGSRHGDNTRRPFCYHRIPSPCPFKPGSIQSFQRTNMLYIQCYLSPKQKQQTSSGSVEHIQYNYHDPSYTTLPSRTGQRAQCCFCYVFIIQ